MDWKDLTSHQKLCQIQLTPDTPMGYIHEIVGKLQSPWKNSDCKFTWSLVSNESWNNFTLKIHAMKLPKKG